MGLGEFRLSGLDRLSGARVLVAEDEVIICMELQQLLEDHGAKALECHTLESALETAQTQPLSAAILDVRIGAAVISPVARLLADKGVPFVFYSGQSGTDPAIAAWPRAPLVSKPSAGGALMAAVAGLLPGG